MTQSFEPLHFLEKIFDRAVEAADPMLVIPAILPDKPKGRVVVVGAGKASARMAEAVERVWGACEGLVITRYGYARPCKSIKIVEAAHPVPDQSGFSATQKMLDLLSPLNEDDFVLCLISGGGSSLLVSPKTGVSLAEKQQINTDLLMSGAPINEMNVVRKFLSNVKGGQLAAAAYPAKMLSLIISDVAGDNPSDIASGPTVGVENSVEDAKNILKKYNILTSISVKNALEIKASVLPTDAKELSKTRNQIISAPSHSLDAAAKLAIEMGVEVRVIGTDLEGEARVLGIEHARLARKAQCTMQIGHKPILLLSGGECTVTRNKNLLDTGAVGGPNAEYLLSAAIELDGAKNIYAIACDTDGVDGTAEVAGATIDQETIERAISFKINPKLELFNNNSHGFFANIGSQIITGPTLTNVNDFRAFLIFPN